MGSPGTVSPQSWDSGIRSGRIQILGKPLNLEASSETPSSFHSQLSAGCDSHGNEPMAQITPLWQSKGPRAALLDPRGPRALGRNAHSWCLLFPEPLMSVRSSSPQKKRTRQHTKCLRFPCLPEAITRTPGDLQTPGGHSALACPHSGEGTQAREGPCQGPPHLPGDALPACASPCRRGAGRARRGARTTG